MHRAGQALEPRLRAHSADLAPVPAGPREAAHKHPQSQPADRPLTPRPACAALAPAHSRQGFQIEAVGGSRHGESRHSSPAPRGNRPLGFVWQIGSREGPRDLARSSLQLGAVDVAPRLHRHSWQPPPLRTVKMSGPQRVH